MSNDSASANKAFYWSSIQKRVIRACDSGKSFFFTGGPGSGKSWVMQECIARRKQDLGERCVAVTAPTAFAAFNVGGCTFQSFAGAGTNAETCEKSLEKLKEFLEKNKTAIDRWMRTKVLFIDEVSMLSGRFFTQVERLARWVIGGNTPFGGIQIIASGDFFQLQPEVRKNSLIDFCFDTPTWKRCFESTIVLREPFRQGEDDEFISLLNEVRVGRISRKSNDILMSIESDNSPRNYLATCLYPLRHQAGEVNLRQLSKLSGEVVEFVAEDSGEPGPLSALKKFCPAPEVLTLKLFSPVLLLKDMTLNLGLPYGAQGVVQKIVEGIPIVKFGSEFISVCSEQWFIKMNEKIVATRKQIPLELGWALSIDKR